MIESINSLLENWVKETLEDVKFSLDVPSDSVKEESVNLYLLEILPGQEARGTGRPPLRLTLHYLVSALGKETSKVHRNLLSLAFSVLENREWKIAERENLSSIWRDFGLAPRPSFVLEVPCRKSRPEKVAPPVKQPLALEITPIEQLNGLVLGPNDFPMARTRVEILGTGFVTKTDHNGKFRISGFPAKLKNKLEFKLRSQVVSGQVENACWVLRYKPLGENHAD